MKTIEPVQVWYNGQEVNATVLNAYASNVELNVSASFYYTLYSVNEYNKDIYQVNGGVLKMEGQAYQDWDQDVFAWDWVAAQLNLTITGEYVPVPFPPIPPFTTTTTSPTTTTTTEAPTTTTTTESTPIA
jgi:hypothetical protein